MNVFKRKNSENYYFKFVDGGRAIWRSTGYSKKKEAVAYAEAFMTKIRNGEVGLITKTEAPTFKKIVDDFFKSREAKLLAVTTVNRYKSAAPPLLKFFGNKTVDQIKTIDIESYINKRSKQYAHRPGKTLKDGTIIKPKPTEKLISTASVNKELSLLKKLIGKLVDLDIIPKNPTKSVKKLKETNEAGRVLNRAEETLYLNACNANFRDFVIILAETGMRPGELIRMKISNVNLANRTFFVEKGKTPSARRFIPITQRASEAVERRLSKARRGVYLFPGGRHIQKLDDHIVKYNGAHYAALKLSKIDGENRTGTAEICTLYSFRHTFATRFVESGGNIITLGALMGHSDLRQLMRYSHPSDLHKFDAINKMSEQQQALREKEEKQARESAKECGLSAKAANV